MLESKEQIFVAQKCGDNCTCHNHITKDKSKDIPEATISAHLIRGIELDSVGNVVEKTEIGKQNANVHNFLAHLKYRILSVSDMPDMPKDKNLSIFDNPPEELTIHDNGFDKQKQADISAEQKKILDQLTKLTIETPADIKTFAEKIIKIDCNTDGLDILINKKLKQIKGVVQEYKKSNPNRPLILDDINKAHEIQKRENKYKKEVKDIIKEGLNINTKDKIKKLTADQVKSLASSEEIKTKFSTLNNEYNGLDLKKTDDSLYKTVDSFVANEKLEENISLIEKILNFLGINVNKNAAVKAVVNNSDVHTQMVEEKQEKENLAEQKNVPSENNVVENLLKQLDLGILPSFTKKTEANCTTRGTSLNDIIMKNTDKKVTPYGNPVNFNDPQNKNISIVDLSANIGISYGTGRNNEYSAHYNKRRFDSFSTDDKKYITDNMSLSNRDFSKLFILTTLKTSVDKCKNILNDKDKCVTLINDFKKSFDADLHKKTDQFAAADLLLFLIDQQHKINKDNQGITKDDITKDNLISCIDSISKTINGALAELKKNHVPSTETITDELKQPKIKNIAQINVSKKYTGYYTTRRSNEVKSKIKPKIINRLKFDSSNNIFSETNTKTQPLH